MNGAGVSQAQTSKGTMASQKGYACHRGDVPKWFHSHAASILATNRVTQSLNSIRACDGTPQTIATDLSERTLWMA